MYKPLSYLIALLFLLIGCNNEIEKELYVSEVPILIAPKQIETSSTKTTFESFNQDITSIGVIEVYNENRILTPSGISPSGITSDYLAFTNPPLVYPVDGSNVTLYGYYPSHCGSISEGQFCFTLTGQEDLMWAAAVDAGNKTTHSPVSMLFNHKLAKISFRLESKLELASDILSTLLEHEIQLIAEGPASGSMNLLDGRITNDPTSNELTLLTGLTLKSIIEGTKTMADGELLLLPASDYLLSLSINNKKYPITFNGNSSTQSWAASTCYQLTITIAALNDRTTASKCSPVNSSITANITLQN